MTETLHNLARPYSADSPLAYLLDMAERVAAKPTEQEERDDAEMAAAHHLYTAYYYNLGSTVDATTWQGYPALREPGGRQWEASAVAWLDGGLWLHHTLRITERDGAVDVLTLIVPCTCGRGYVDITLDSEDMLMEVLAELRPTHGRAPHTEEPLDCGSVHGATRPTGWR